MSNTMTENGKDPTEQSKRRKRNEEVSLNVASVGARCL